jgi:serine/threonine protein kinase
MNSRLQQMEDMLKRRLDDIEACLRGEIERTSKAGDGDVDRVDDIDMRALKFQKTAVSLLGHGAFGDVYLGVYGDIAVAVKVATRTLEETTLRELKKEVVTLNILSRYPGIVRTFGANFDPRRGDLCIVFELAQGTLYDALYNVKNSRLPSTFQLPDELKLFALSSVAKALAFVASANIIHRDIKPQNILVFLPLGSYDSPTFKLSDFGIAKNVSDNVRNRIALET